MVCLTVKPSAVSVRMWVRNGVHTYPPRQRWENARSCLREGKKYFKIEIGTWAGDMSLGKGTLEPHGGR